MTTQCPPDPLAFIAGCVRGGRILWTYHVNMRLLVRRIDRTTVLAGIDTFELIEAYPDDKYLPSYLVLSWVAGEPLHILFATDVPGDNVRIVTAYRPDPQDWTDHFARRSAP